MGLSFGAIVFIIFEMLLGILILHCCSHCENTSQIHNIHDMYFFFSSYYSKQRWDCAIAVLGRYWPCPKSRIKVTAIIHRLLNKSGPGNHRLDLTKTLHWQVLKGKNKELGRFSVFQLHKPGAKLSLILSPSLFPLSFNSFPLIIFLFPSLVLCVIASICSPGIDGVNTLLTHATVRHWHLWEPLAKTHTHTSTHIEMHTCITSVIVSMQLAKTGDGRREDGLWDFHASA